MAGEKEIRSKIASVKNMQKITSAMEKVAASKIRKAQQQMEASRPYAQRIRRVVGHLTQANPDYRHPFLTEREVKRVGYIVISTDRGLCGGFNGSIVRQTRKLTREHVAAGRQVKLLFVGKKAHDVLKREMKATLGSTRTSECFSQVTG